MLQLDAVQTLALAGLALFLGYALCRVIPVLGRYNLPPAYVGAMWVLAAVRNIDDRTGWIRLSVPTTELIGNACLALPRARSWWRRW